MSSHRKYGKNFSRKFNARKALIRGLVDSLVKEERILTTLAKAKELRRHVERAITIGKRGDLASRRLLLSRLASGPAVEKVFKTLADRFKNRAGGYTRIIRVGPRAGDKAPMAMIEFVDFDFKNKVIKDSSKSLKAQESSDSALSGAPVVGTRKKVSDPAARKRLRKIQSASRAANRA
jgi:large subunit ribosomal protein L17